MKTLRLLPLALVAVFIPLLAHAAAAVSISLNPATGVAPYTSTLTWNVTGAATCTASDGWSGSKALTGTQAVTVSAATKYTLTCTASDGQTTTTWTPPIANTDSSPLTDLAGFNIYRGTTATNLARIKSVGAAVTTYQDTGLAPGTYYYALTAVNAASRESAQARTTPYPIAVTGSSASSSASAGIDTIPNPPGGPTTTTISVTTSTQVTVTNP